MKCLGSGNEPFFNDTAIPTSPSGGTTNHALGDEAIANERAASGLTNRRSSDRLLITTSPGTMSPLGACP